MVSLTAGYLQVVGAIFARLVIGVFTNRFGPRYAMGFLLILSSSAVFGMALVRENTSFIIVRCMIGFALASFVPCQFWTSVLFTAPLVGSANAIAGGWGNLGEPPPPVRLQPGDGQIHALGTSNMVECNPIWWNVIQSSWSSCPCMYKHYVRALKVSKTQHVWNPCKAHKH